jgi:ATP-dependent phosphofructokinase / diphosphate-dependent phosphofructokinase
LAADEWEAALAPTYVIAQSGGPTAVINQTLAGAVIEARRHHPGARVLGARHGIRGVRDGDFVNLTDLSEEVLRQIGATPGAALGSTRDKPDEAYCQAVLKSLEGIDAQAFINIGGNDTAGTQQILSQAVGGKIAFVHAPKTIDNDLMENDHTPGFISAAEFVAGAFLGIDLDFRALKGVYVGIVMGRHAGFIAASSAAWRLDEESGPHIIYVPERSFDRARFIDDVRATVTRHGRCLVAVSEGVSTASGRSLVEELVPAEMLERDAHGNVRLSGSDLAQAFERMLAEDLPKVRSRVDTFGYLPRGNIATINAQDAEEAFFCGRFAIEAADHGGGSVAIQLEGDKTVYRTIDLGLVAAKTRHMPASFLKTDENTLSEEGIAYFERLVPRRYKVAHPFV